MSKWRGVLLGGGIALALAGGSMWFGGSPGASGAGEARMEFVPGTSNVSLSEDSFELEVRLSNVNNLGGWGLIVEFDNDALEYLGASSLGFLSSTGRQGFCGSTQPAVGNQYGAFQVDCGTFGIVEDGVGKMG